MAFYFVEDCNSYYHKVGCRYKLLKGEVESMAEIVEGYIEKIVFRNDENGYTVFSLIYEEDELTCRIYYFNK